mmetsp:Transcript_71483/g.119718  ORF Transcript_71483/g.119718 Transcript_71483/m.119718 type:complete len:335 (+) Transcript_71483:210-1214(+)
MSQALGLGQLAVQLVLLFTELHTRHMAPVLLREAAGGVAVPRPHVHDAHVLPRRHLPRQLLHRLHGGQPDALRPQLHLIGLGVVDAHVEALAPPHRPVEVERVRAVVVVLGLGIHGARGLADPALQHPDLQQRPVAVRAERLLLVLAELAVAGGPAAHEREILQEDALHLVGLLGVERVQEVDDGVPRALARGELADDLVHRLGGEVDERRRADQKVCGLHRWQDLGDACAGVHIRTDRRIIDATGRGVVQGALADVDPGDVARETARAGDGLAGRLIAPVLVDLLHAHAIDDRHRGVPKATEQINNVAGLLQLGDQGQQQAVKLLAGEVVAHV